MSEETPVRIVLTPEQRAAIHRLSSQHVDAIEVTPDDVKQGGGLRTKRVTAVTLRSVAHDTPVSECI